jgi:pilus assembly protein CpaC
MTKSAVVLAALCLAVAVLPVSGQEVLTRGQEVISVAKGKSALVTQTQGLQRVAVGDPAIAEAVVVSPTELLVNGREIGSTTIIMWSQRGQVTLSSVEVVPDVEGISRQIAGLFPGADVRVAAAGRNVVLSGATQDPTLIRRIIDIAKTSGANVIPNFQAPSAAQVLLQVRFAEVTRSAALRLSTAIGTLNPQRLQPNQDDKRIETLSDGLVRLFLMGANDSLDILLRALRQNGQFRSLAEPNLLTLEGQEASFLAGGEFPFPVVQGTTGTVTIVWKEFGVRLTFTPNVTATGAIRLVVEPEVSSLDFANALSFGGFRIPSVLTRRAKTQVELAQGQHLAIAGLVDNSLTDNVTKIPLLGDIPILGTFFRSKDAQQNRTELLVIVTPRVVQPTDTMPRLPTGETDTWKWMRGMRQSTPSPEEGRKP